MVQTSLNSDVKLAQNLPAIKDGLNLIFTMSSIDLKNEYNVSLEELIIKYQNRMNLVRR